MNTNTYTLVSATQGEIVPGVEISDPDAPLGWWDLPADAQEWATAQGYGEDDAELLYILGAEDDAPEGFAVHTVTPT